MSVFGEPFFICNHMQAWKNPPDVLEDLMDWLVFSVTFVAGA